MKVTKFNYDTRNQLLEDAAKLGYELPVSERPVQVLRQEFKLREKVFQNRILAQPVEGFDALPDGAPSVRTVERYETMVRHGFRALWLESVSISEQGRSNPAQLWITEKNADAFRQMTDAIRSQTPEPVHLTIQLTHSGRYSSPAGKPAPICAFSNPWIPKERERIISDAQVEEVEEDYVKAALLAERAGFDAVDIRACHGYLINEFLGAYGREGRYGGSFHNRIRFYIETIDRVKEAVSAIEVGTRLNMYDGLPYPYGWGADAKEPQKQCLQEPLQLIGILYGRGVRLFNITNGTGAYAPYIIRPYDSGGKEPTEPQLAGVDRMLQCARMAKECAPEAVVVASGFSWLREYAPAVAAGGIEKGWFDLAGFGRQTIAYPDMVEDLFTDGGMRREKCCRACCGCTTMIKVKGEQVKCIFRKQ